MNHDIVKLSSSKSLRISLEDVKYGSAGLNKHRRQLLNRVPNTNDWARFAQNSLTYEKYRNSSTTAFGDFSEEGIAYCYVGVDDQPIESIPSEPLVLSNKAYNNPIPFFASCNVVLESGAIMFLECALPN